MSYAFGKGPYHSIGLLREAIEAQKSPVTGDIPVETGKHRAILNAKLRASAADDIVEAYERLGSLLDVATYLEIRPDTVSRVLDERGVRRRNSDPSLQAKIKRRKMENRTARLYMDGLSQREIGKRVGVSATHVGRILREVGIQTRLPGGRATTRGNE